MKKKVLSLLMAFVMLLSLLPVTAMAASYQDTDGHWAEAAIDRWSDYGVIQGNNGSFNPDGMLTRAHMAAILCRLLNLPAAEDAGFKDVKPGDWFADYINRCAAAGIMLGDNGYAYPNATITRQQAVVMLARALKIAPLADPDLSDFADAAQVSSYAKGYLAAMAEAGIVKGTSATTLSPLANITRAATVTILHRAIEVYANEANAEVKATGTGLVLIAADNVKVTAPAGTVVIIPEHVDGIIVNGVKVSADQAYEVPAAAAGEEEKEDKPATGGSTGGSSGGSSGGHIHNYGDWTPVGDGTHTRVCGRNESHVQTQACEYTYAKKDGGVHDKTCDLCGEVIVGEFCEYDAESNLCVCGNELEVPAGDYVYSVDGEGYENLSQALEAGAGGTKTILVLKDRAEYDMEFAGPAVMNFNGFSVNNLTINGGEVTIANVKSGNAVKMGGGADVTLNGVEITTESGPAVIMLGEDDASEMLTLDGVDNKLVSGNDSLQISAGTDFDCGLDAEGYNMYSFLVGGSRTMGWKQATIDQLNTRDAALQVTIHNDQKIEDLNLPAGEVIYIDPEVTLTISGEVTGAGEIWQLGTTETQLIYNAEQLAALAEVVNGGYNYAEKDVKLMADIDLANEAWTPIGTSAAAFSGVFDGNGHTVSNLAAEGEACVGLFGRIAYVNSNDMAVVKNLKIKNAVVTGVNNVGAIVGYAYTGDIINCEVSGTIQISGNYKVGGIAGGADYCDLYDCTVTGDENSYIAASFKEADLEGDNVGGIAGFIAESKTIEDCDAKINVSGTRKVGGIVGSFNGGTAVTGCTYSGNVTCVADETYRADNAGKLFVGGIVGEVTDPNGITLSDCKVSNSVITGVEITGTGAIWGGTRKSTPITGTDNDATDNVTVIVQLADGFIYNVLTEQYEVSSVAGLKYLATSTNAGNSYSGETIVLIDDLNLKNEEWTPIGTSSAKFSGVFDGQENTISNLKISGAGKTNIGLFGYTTDGEIKNLTVENAEITGRLNVGVVAGSPYTSKYTNIKVTGLVKVDGMSYVGGVGGKNAYADWTNITMDVEEGSYVNANSVENGSAYRTYVGGVVGFMGEGGHTMQNVTSNIDVIGSTCDVGGIVGIAHYGNSFINCSSSGDVTITSADEKADAQEIGGIAGVWHNGGADVTFEECTYTGKLTANYGDKQLAEDEFYYNGLVGAPYSANGTGKLILIVEEGAFTYDIGSVGKGLLLVDDSVSGTLQVEEGVTAIGGYAFAYNDQIEEIVLPSTVTTLNDRAFRDTSASNVVLNEGLENISYQAFRNASNVKTVEIPSTVTTISKEAFQNSGVETLTVPATVTTIEYGAMRDMKELEEVTIEGNVEIPVYAFRACTNLKTVYLLGDDVTFAGRGMIFTNKENGDGSAITIYVANETVKERLIAADTAAKDYGGYKIVVMSTVSEGLKKDEDGNYYVYSAKGLEALNDWFAANWSAHAMYGITYNICADIDATGMTWDHVWLNTPGNRMESFVFDGKGHTISNLTINGNAMFGGSMTGATAETATMFKNLTLKDVTVTGPDNGYHVGVLVGQAASSIAFDNVCVDNAAVSGKCNVGGILGSTGEFNGEVTIAFNDCAVVNSKLTANGTDVDPTGASAFIGRALGATVLTFTGENAADENTITNAEGLVGGGIYGYTNYSGGWVGTGKCDTFTDWAGIQ